MRVSLTPWGVYCTQKITSAMHFKARLQCQSGQLALGTRTTSNSEVPRPKSRLAVSALAGVFLRRLDLSILPYPSSICSWKVPVPVIVVVCSARRLLQTAWYSVIIFALYYHQRYSRIHFIQSESSSGSSCTMQLGSSRTHHWVCTLPPVVHIWRPSMSRQTRLSLLAVPILPLRGCTWSAALSKLSDRLSTCFTASVHMRCSMLDNACTRFSWRNDTPPPLAGQTG